MHTRQVSLALPFLLSAALAAPCFAGGTPATGTTADELILMGGADAPASSGDSISASDGLNTAYRFYIEVPPSQTDLQVDLYDADVLSNASDEVQERDRDRGLEKTSVRYQLFDPAGNLVANRFNYGDNNNPPSSHGAWKKFYDNKTAGLSGGTTFRDNFTTRAYTNNDGTGSFAGNWTEVNDLGGGGATGGDIQVTTGGVLRIANTSDPSPFVNQPTIYRETNLSSFTSAIVTFDFTSGSGVDPLVAPASSGDSIAFEVSSNGGTTYTVLEEFADINGTLTGSRSYDVTEFIAANTRFRFHITMRYAAANEYFEVDNFEVRGTTSANGANPTSGHWLLKVDMSTAVNADQDRSVPPGGTLRDDVNAFGIRAHDGTPGSGGQEFNVYAESFTIAGVNRNNGLRDYHLYPWVNAGCTVTEHDFDYDADLAPEGGPNLNVQPYGSWSFTSRSGAFTANSTGMSNNNTWRSQGVTSWTSMSSAIDYGIWSYLLRIEDNGPGNYAPLYITYNRDAGEPPPTSNPENGAFRIYLPTDAGVAPVKPYLQHRLTHVAQSGPNPPQVGVTSRFAITITVQNPSGSIGSIAFSNSNVVTARIPGGQAVYGGPGFVSQGAFVSQPALGGSGNVTWNPGTIAPGASATMVYLIDVTPSGAADVVVTGVVASGNGTRATYVDETGNTTQARATVTIGEVCELTVDFDSPTPALVTSFTGRDAAGGGRLVEWRTAAEAGTLSFDLYRLQDGQPVKVNAAPLLALVDAPQGGAYRFLDAGAEAGQPATYTLAENDSRGQRRFYGPFTTAVADAAATAPAAGYSREPKAPAALDVARRRDARVAIVADLKAGGAADGTARGGSHAAYRMKIAEPGFYQLPAAQLAGLFGLSPAEVAQRLAAGSFDLRRGESQVAWTSWSDTSGAALAFWGEPPASPFYAESVYWLRLGPGATITDRRGSDPPAAGGSPTTRERLSLEKDVRPLVLMSLDPDSDIYFWDFVSPGAASTKSFELVLPAISPAAGAARLWVDLQGAADGNHQLALSANGTPLGSLALVGKSRAQLALEVPAGVLRSGSNTVQVQSLAGGLVFLDHFEVAYDRDLRAGGDYLESRFGPTRFASARLFTSPEVVVFDLADPDRPMRLGRAKTRPELGGTFRVDFENGAAGGRFVALGRSGLRPAPTPELAAATGLASPANQAEYLVIAPPALLGPARDIANYRRDGGLVAMAVSLEGVYDEFAAGHADPRAIGAFLAYAKQNWALPPRYVLLAGSGSYDWKNVQGYGDNLLPMLLVDRGGSLFPSDARFADLQGNDGVPEIAIGRVPALSAAELSDYLRKLEAYERGEVPWTDEVMLLADGADANFDFAAEARHFTELLPRGFASEVLALGEQPSLAAARGQLFGALGDGRAWVTYVGHGGVDRLSPQGLLTKSDVPGLGNEGRLFVLQTVSCHVGLHGLPGFDSLGEDLVIDPAAGAVAVFAPAWLSEHDEAKLLADRLLRQVFQQETPRLGDAIREAERSAAENGVPSTLLDAYQLLGDPALRLRLEPRAPAPPPSCAPDCGQG